jgi:hypothetical protein
MFVRNRGQKLQLTFHIVFLTTVLVYETPGYDIMHTIYKQKFDGG